MAELSVAPDIGGLEIPIDAWTKPFWEGTARHELLMPSCDDCGRFRWPPGPFCPHCRSQAVLWKAAGEGRVYSFTVLHVPRSDGSDEHATHIPGLIEFPAADSVRVLAAIVRADPAALRIGDRLRVEWIGAGGNTVPAFTPIR